MVRRVICDDRLPELYFAHDSENHMMKILRNISSADWFKNQVVKLNGKYSPPFSETLTVNGIGFTFNSKNPSEILNLEKYTNGALKINQ